MSMTKDNLRRVIALGHELNIRAMDVERELVQADRNYPICGTAKTGSLRRTSMEMTRALAELRKP